MKTDILDPFDDSVSAAIRPLLRLINERCSHNGKDLGLLEPVQFIYGEDYHGNDVAYVELYGEASSTERERLDALLRFLLLDVGDECLWSWDGKATALRKTPWDGMSLGRHQYPLRFSLLTKEWTAGYGEVHTIRYLVVELPRGCEVDLRAAREQINAIIRRMEDHLAAENTADTDHRPRRVCRIIWTSSRTPSYSTRQAFHPRKADADIEELDREQEHVAAF